MSKKTPKCEECNRPQKYFEGCSHIPCPKRRHVSLKPYGKEVLRPESDGGCYIKLPTDKVE